jgi:hypothetical protein
LDALVGYHKSQYKVCEIQFSDIVSICADCCKEPEMLCAGLDVPWPQNYVQGGFKYGPNDSGFGTIHEKKSKPGATGLLKHTTLNAAEFTYGCWKFGVGFVDSISVTPMALNCVPVPAGSLLFIGSIAGSNRISGFFYTISSGIESELRIFDKPLIQYRNYLKSSPLSHCKVAYEAFYPNCFIARSNARTEFTFGSVPESTTSSAPSNKGTSTGASTSSGSTGFVPPAAATGAFTFGTDSPSGFANESFREQYPPAAFKFGTSSCPASLKSNGPIDPVHVVFYRPPLRKLDAKITSLNVSRDQHHRDCAIWRRHIRDIGFVAAAKVTSAIIADAIEAIEKIDPRFENFHAAVRVVLDAWFAKKKATFQMMWSDHCRSLVISQAYVQRAFSFDAAVHGHATLDHDTDVQRALSFDAAVHGHTTLDHDTLFMPNGLTMTLSDMLFSELSMNSLDDYLFTPAFIENVFSATEESSDREANLKRENCADKRKMVSAKVEALDQMIEALESLRPSFGVE